MISSKIIFSLSFLFFISVSDAQTISETINQLETQHKECIKLKEDSTACSRIFLFQMDSILKVLVNVVKEQTPSNAKAAFIQNQTNWNKKKNEFFRKQDETYKAYLADGTWKKEMIRITYRQKADYILKRIKYLLKSVVETSN